MKNSVVSVFVLLVATLSIIGCGGTEFGTTAVPITCEELGLCQPSQIIRPNKPTKVIATRKPAIDVERLRRNCRITINGSGRQYRHIGTGTLMQPFGRQRIVLAEYYVYNTREERISLKTARPEFEAQPTTGLKNIHLEFYNGQAISDSVELRESSDRLTRYDLNGRPEHSFGMEFRVVRLVADVMTEEETSENIHLAMFQPVLRDSVTDDGLPGIEFVTESGRTIPSTEVCLYGTSANNGVIRSDRTMLTRYGVDVYPGVLSADAPLPNGGQGAFTIFQSLDGDQYRNVQEITFRAAGAAGKMASIYLRRNGESRSFLMCEVAATSDTFTCPIGAFTLAKVATYVEIKFDQPLPSQTPISVIGMEWADFVSNFTTNIVDNLPATFTAP